MRERTARASCGGPTSSFSPASRRHAVKIAGAPCESLGMCYVRGGNPFRGFQRSIDKRRLPERKAPSLVPTRLISVQVFRRRAALVNANLPVCEYRCPESETHVLTDQLAQTARLSDGTPPSSDVKTHRARWEIKSGHSRGTGARARARWKKGLALADGSRSAFISTRATSDLEARGLAKSRARQRQRQRQKGGGGDGGEKRATSGARSRERERERERERKINRAGASRLLPFHGGERAAAKENHRKTEEREREPFAAVPAPSRRPFSPARSGVRRARSRPARGETL